MRKVLALGVILCSIFIFSNCASIIHGPRQNVDFSSQPSGAKISINGQEFGKTPRTIALRRKGFAKGEPKGNKEYAVKIELDGYYPYEIKVKRQMDGWFIGNLVFGGLIGIVIDAANGSMYKLNPDQIIAQMGKTTTGAYNKEDNLYIAVVLRPDPNWEKIGSLEKK